MYIALSNSHSIAIVVYFTSDKMLLLLLAAAAADDDDDMGSDYVVRLLVIEFN